MRFSSKAQLSTLLAPSNPERDPEGLISRYVEFEFDRARMYEAFDLFTSRETVLRGLYWYLTGKSRPPHSRPPLSEQQIVFLNSKLPMLGRERLLTIACHSFAALEIPGLLEEDTEAAFADLAYWWCVERTPALAAPGVLTPPDMIAALQQVDVTEARADFPLNRFCALHVQSSPRYRDLDLHSPFDRIVFLAALFMEAGEYPHLAPLLPASAMLNLMKPRGASPPLLEELLEAAPNARGEGAKPEALNGSALRRAVEVVFAREGVGIGAVRRNCEATTHRFRPSSVVSEELRSGVNVIGPLTASSGLGQAARLSFETLIAAGEDVEALDFVWGNPAAKGARTVSTVKQLSAPAEINLIHMNAESLPPVFSHLDPVLFEHSYNIGFFYWELDVIPRCHRLALEMLDEVWVASAYNREIYSRYTDKPVMEMGVAVEPLPEISGVSWSDFGLEKGPFTYLTTFDSFSYVQRKNPTAVIEAFQQAFPLGGGENVRLILKTQNRRHVSDRAQSKLWGKIDQALLEDPRIILLDKTLAYREVIGLKSLCDAYVSLHRSEGWGFGLIESMQLGLPVIATNYSGNTSFTSEECALIVDYDLIPVQPNEYIYVEPGSSWANPDIAQAAAYMRRLFDEPATRHTLSRAGKATVRRIASIPAAAERYAARLAAIRERLRGGA